MIRTAILIRAKVLIITLFLLPQVLLSQVHQSHDTSSGSHTRTDGLDGVTVDFLVDPNHGPGYEAGESLRIGFRVSDSQTGKGVSDLRPSAWMNLRRAGEAKPDEEACVQMIRTFQRTGVLTVPADADLNGFSILTVNADNSVGILNPKVNLKTSNLQALIHFKGQPAQWALDQEHGLVFLTLPEEGKVAVVDIQRQELKKYIAVGEKPRSVLLHSGGAYLWVGNDGSGTVSVIERSSLSVVQTLEVGSGAVELALDADGRFAFAGTAAEGRVSIIDIAKMMEVGRVTLGSGKLSLAYSSQRGALFVSNKASGALTVIDPEGKKASGFSLEPGIHTLTATPDGRFILALIPDKRKIVVIESATNRVLGELPTEADPDHIVFSPSYAYVRNRSTPNITVIELSGLENPAKVPVAHIPIGVIAPATVKSLPDVSTMAAMHHGGHALIVNPADFRVYMYMEGMMAPMNSFKTYTSRPLGIMLYDRSLEEGATAGNYETVVNLKEPGIYDVPFYLNDPRKVECFELVIKANPGREQKRAVKPSLTEMFTERIFQPGVKSSLHFKLLDAETGNSIPDINDVMLMGVLKNTHWQHRAQARHIGNGIYEAEFKFPSEGRYYILVEARSLGIKFGDLRYSIAHVAG